MTPDGWKITRLENIAYIQTGLAKGKKGLKNIVTLPYIRVANVQDGYFDLSEIKEIEIDANQISRYLLQKDDILLTEGGDFDKLGRGSIWKGMIEPCLHQNHVFAVRVNRQFLNPHFFCHQTNSFYGKSYFLSCAKQTTNLASINSTQLKDFPVLLPPLPEQRKIAEILGAWDEGIDRLAQLIAAKRKLKQALMQQLLTGKRRFKEFDGNEWKIVKLGDLCSVITKGTTPSSLGSEYCSEGINFLKVESVSNNGQILIDKTAKITQETHELLKRSQLEELDIIFSIAGALGRVAIVNRNILPANTNQALAIIRMKENYIQCHQYIFQYLKSEVVSKHVACVNVQAAQANLSLSQVRDFKVIFPPLPEQEKIAIVLTTIDREIEILEQKLGAYKQQKRGLMQQLLTGKKRVKI